MISYPKDILPHKGWRECICVDEIIKCCPDAIIGHLIEEKQEDCLDTTLGDDYVRLRIDALPYKRIPNLSCSLFGAKFQPQHFHFLPINKGRESWQGNVDISDELLKDDNYRFISDIVVIGWKITNLHKWPVKYTRSFDKKSDFQSFSEKAEAVAKLRNIKLLCIQEWEKLIKELGPTQTKRVCIDVWGEARLNHDPTMLNYWHFTIDCYSADDDTNPILNIKNWRNNLAIALGDYLRQVFFFVNDATIIPQISTEKLWIKDPCE